MTSPKTIFVQIASYRDRELPATIRNMYKNAVNPERIHTGVVNQADPEKDPGCLIFENNANIRQIIIPPMQSKGVGWARSKAQELWRGEDFSLQLDSHCRFVPGWDVKIIEMLTACDSPKPVLSTYPMAYTPPDDIYQGTAVPRLFAQKFDQNDILRFVAYSIPAEKAGPKPSLGAFTAGGFVFSSAELIEKAPYNPDYYFHGEEIARTVTMWTHGWDIFHPNANLIFHYYHTVGVTKHKKHWDDHTEWSKLDNFSAHVTRALLEMEPPSKMAKKSIAGHPLGKVRTLDQYQKFAGVDFKTKSISEKAKKGPFAPIR